MFSGISPLLLFPALSSKNWWFCHKGRGTRGPFDSRMKARERASSFWKIKLKSLWSLAELGEAQPAVENEYLAGLSCHHPHTFERWGVKEHNHHPGGVLSLAFEDKGYLEPGHFSTGQHCPGKLEILAVTGCRNWRFLRISLQEQQSSRTANCGLWGQFLSTSQHGLLPAPHAPKSNKLKFVISPYPVEYHVLLWPKSQVHELTSFREKPEALFPVVSPRLNL